MMRRSSDSEAQGARQDECLSDSPTQIVTVRHSVRVGVGVNMSDTAACSSIVTVGMSAGMRASQQAHQRHQSAVPALGAQGSLFPALEDRSLPR